MMRKAERGFGTGRFVAVLMLSSFAIALAGCGGDSGSAATGAATGATTSATTSSTSSSTPTVADQGSPEVFGGAKGGSPITAPPSTASSSSVTLGWQAPTQNNDGTPITDLAGYKIHYGTSSTTYTQTVSLQNAGLTRYVVDNLPSGTYYFAITAYNSKGLESSLSGEISTAVVN